MVRDYEKYMNLAKVANSTFGTTGVGDARVSTQHIKVEVVDENTMKLHFQSIVNFPSKSMLRETMPKHKIDAIAMVEATIKKFAELYKAQYGEDLTISVRDNSYHDNVEFTSFSMYSPNQRGYYRLQCLADIK